MELKIPATTAIFVPSLKVVARIFLWTAHLAQLRRNRWRARPRSPRGAQWRGWPAASQDSVPVREGRERVALRICRSVAGTGRACELPPWPRLREQWVEGESFIMTLEGNTITVELVFTQTRDSSQGARPACTADNGREGRPNVAAELQSHSHVINDYHGQKNVFQSNVPSFLQ